MTIDPTDRRRNRGFALIIVLWAAVILALIAGGVGQISKGDVAETRRQEDRLRAELAAESGVAAALQGLIAGAWPTGPGPETWRMDSAEIRVVVTDEAGRIDLNAAEIELIGALFSTLGASVAESARIADGVADLRKRREGDEAAPPAFAMVEGLRRAPGMTPTLYQAAAEAVTVYTGAPRPAAAAAPPAVLDALDAPQGAPAPAADAGAATPAPIAATAELGRIFRIHAEAQTDAGAVFARLAVIVLPREAGAAHQTLLWTRAPRRLFPAQGF